MPICVNGVRLEELPPSVRTFLHSYPFKESASSLCAQPQKVVGGVGLLYVTQREYAVTWPHDKNISILGSDDATTCHIVVLRHPGSGTVGVGHFDQSGVEEGIEGMIRRVLELSMGYPETRLELSIVGGFSGGRMMQDNRELYSEHLTLALLNALHRQPYDVELVICCVGEMNTTMRGGIPFPIIYGIGVNVKTGEIFPAQFPDKGPDIPLRQARSLAPGHLQMLDIYDCHLEMLRIGPFNYEPLRGIDLWLQMPDEVILQHLSTSSDVEPPHFVAQIRASLGYIKQHPFPLVTVFPENRSRYFQKDESGAWMPVRY